MSTIDVDYFLARAAAEHKLALKSDKQSVAAIHEELARQYEAMSARVEPQTSPWTDKGEKHAA